MKWLCFTTALLLWSTGSAQRSPFNGLQVLPADSNGHYRILIGGHFHGESTNRSGYPAATLLANLDTINALGANLFLSTGDLFMDPVNDWPRYDRSLFSKLKMPLFNAPGNHDVDDDLEREHSGLSDSMWRVREYVPGLGILNPYLSQLSRMLTLEEVRLLEQARGDDFVLLDTESQEGMANDQAISYLHDVVENVVARRTRSVFILSHRPIWAEDDPEYSPLFEGNTRSLTGTNFKKDVYPLLEKIAEHAHVYWISGSMGGQAPSSIFFQQHAKNITYIQCAIRDEPRDALLIADVYPDTVKWSALSLTGQTLLAPEAYDAKWWRAHLGKSEGFNWRLLPYLVKSIVTHRAFWWGAGVMALIVLLLARLRRARS